MAGAPMMYGAIIVIILAGVVATVWIGQSKENREGNPAYDSNTVPNWIRLTIIYIVAAAVLCGLLLWAIRGG